MLTTGFTFRFPRRRRRMVNRDLSILFVTNEAVTENTDDAGTMEASRILSSEPDRVNQSLNMS